MSTLSGSHRPSSPSREWVPSLVPIVQVHQAVNEYSLTSVTQVHSAVKEEYPLWPPVPSSLSCEGVPSLSSTVSVRSAVKEYTLLAFCSLERIFWENVRQFTSRPRVGFFLLLFVCLLLVEICFYFVCLFAFSGDFCLFVCFICLLLVEICFCLFVVVFFVCF